MRDATRDATRDARHPTVVLRKQPLSGGEAREVSRLEASAALCRATLPSSDEATDRSQQPRAETSEKRKFVETSGGIV